MYAGEKKGRHLHPLPVTTHPACQKAGWKVKVKQNFENTVVFSFWVQTFRLFLVPQWMVFTFGQKASEIPVEEIKYRSIFNFFP